MSPELAFNTSVSFETNTNWQNYSGETGATYLTQAGGARGPELHLRRDRPRDRDRAVPRADAPEREHDRQLLGRPDARRSCTSCCRSRSSAPSCSSGRAYPRPGTRTHVVTTLEGAVQNIAIGPIASQEWIKELGNNGGGFFNANSAHPFENPTALTNWLEMFAILLFPFALTYTFGRYAGDQRQGWTIFAAMAIVLSIGAVGAMHVEYVGNPLFPAARRPGGPRQHGGQGDPVRVRARRPVHGRHDRHQHRRDQLVARQRPAHRRPRPAVQHGAGRDHARAASAPGCTGC